MLFNTFITAGNDVLGVVWQIKLNYTYVESIMVHYPSLTLRQNSKIIY